MSNPNEAQVERLIACINDRKIEVMDELFHDDATMHWPQSRERVRGAKNHRAIYGSFPQLPTITPRRIVSAGDLVVPEATLDYGGPTCETVFIFGFRDGKIEKENASSGTVDVTGTTIAWEGDLAAGQVVTISYSPRPARWSRELSCSGCSRS